jgi:HPt (histidine-containing phosphotransfer) domain-containing protein
MSVKHANASVGYVPVSITDDTGRAAAGFAIEVIDETVLTALAEAQDEREPDLIVELIDLYLEDAPQWIAAIHSQIAQADLISLKHAAHTLKGSSGSVGVRQVAKICKLIEQMDDNALTANGKMMLQLLDREFARARAALLTERDRRLS